MARDTKDIQFRELKDTISQLNITIAAQTQLITSLQKSLDAANERETETCQHEEVSTPDIETTVKSHTRKAKTTLEEKIKGIPIEEVIVDISDDDKICPQCGTELELIGRETIRHEIEYIPAKVKVKEPAQSRRFLFIKRLM